MNCDRDPLIGSNETLPGSGVSSAGVFRLVPASASIASTSLVSMSRTDRSNSASGRSASSIGSAPMSHVARSSVSSSAMRSARTCLGVRRFATRNATCKTRGWGPGCVHVRGRACGHALERRRSRFWPAIGVILSDVIPSPRPPMRTHRTSTSPKPGSLAPAMVPPLFIWYLSGARPHMGSDFFLGILHIVGWIWSQVCFGRQCSPALDGCHAGRGNRSAERRGTVPG